MASVMSRSPLEAFYENTLADVETLLSGSHANTGEKYGRIFNTLIFKRTQFLQKQLIQQLGTQIQNGPFSGMHFFEQAMEGCYIPKLLGIYEAELHSTLHFIAETAYERIINIGCAEGYYAVGLARLLKNTQVYAFDTNPKAQAACQELALMNHVSEKVVVEGLFRKDDWPTALQSGQSLVICDIEGAEYELFDTDPTCFQDTDVIIELHQTQKRQATAASLLSRFQETHHVRLIGHQGRNPHQFSCLQHFRHLDQWLCVWEFRGENTPWAVMLSKTNYPNFG